MIHIDGLDSLFHLMGNTHCGNPDHMSDDCHACLAVDEVRKHNGVSKCIDLDFGKRYSQRSCPLINQMHTCNTFEIQNVQQLHLNHICTRGLVMDSIIAVFVLLKVFQVEEHCSRKNHLAFNRVLDRLEVNQEAIRATTTFAEIQRRLLYFSHLFVIFHDVEGDVKTEWAAHTHLPSH